jgi:hypothetical protein
METLILNNNSKKDLSILLDFAKKSGLEIKIASKKDLILAEAQILNTSIKPNNISLQEIVEECNIVRKSNYATIENNN